MFNFLKTSYINQTNAMVIETDQPCYTLTRKEKAYIREIVNDVVIPYRGADFDAFVQNCLSASELLPERLIEWKNETEQFQVGLLRNLPTEDYSTDASIQEFMAGQIPMFADGVAGVIAALFGHVQDVCPVLDGAPTQLLYSADVLDWHIEESAHSGLASWMGLLCLHGDQQIVAKIARYEDIQWHQEQLSHLIGTICSQGIDRLYHEEQAISAKIPMLGGSWREPGTIFDTEDVDLESMKADFFLPMVASAEQVSIRVVLEKGDLLMFDNRKTLHARSAIDSNAGVTDRWIKQVLVCLPYEHRLAT